jgi:hypothetical protein
VSAGYFRTLDHRLKGRRSNFKRRLGAQSVGFVPLGVLMTEGFVFAQVLFEKDQVKDLHKGGAPLVCGQ